MEQIDWGKLGFRYIDTHCHIVYTFKNGKWDEGELVASPYLNVHIAASALHYGQAAFEGLKAFRCCDDKIRIFRPYENARRMNSSARRLCMQEVPEELFVEGIKRVIRANQDFVPPYGTGGSLYVRPLLFGSGPQIGVAPAVEYTFIVFVMPVGPYYQGGIKPVSAIIYDDYDRAAPQGIGHIKAAGNYAASLYAHQQAKHSGIPVELYLDPREHRYVEEFATSNFLGITKDKKYVTPSSPSILPSVTNKTLQQLAQDMGYTVEIRPIEFDELDSFEEICACGTAVVVTPIKEIIRGDRVITVTDKDECGPVALELYHRVTGTQYGEIADIHNWLVEV